MDGALSAEARALVASARELLRELSEEGVEGFEPLAAELAVESVVRSEVPTAAEPPFQADPETISELTAPSEAPAPRPPSPSPEAPASVAASSERPSLESIRAELGECTRCRLSEGRNQIVFGDGNPDASLMFIGEGPGQEEDRRGVPFVGRAGELLTKMIERGLEIPRSEVYICNIVKCRPPKNRTPHPDEVSTCQPFLDGQIDAVQPRVIVTLGRPATSLLLGRDVSITKLRGTWQSYRGIPLMPTFHPAFLLRQYTPDNRRAVWNDLKLALERSRG